MARFYVLEIHELLTGKTHFVRWKVPLQNYHDIDANNKVIDMGAPSGHDVRMKIFNISILEIRFYFGVSYEANSTRVKN